MLKKDREMMERMHIKEFMKITFHRIPSSYEFSLEKIHFSYDMLMSFFINLLDVKKNSSIVIKYLNSSS
jgi:hypothetical protein